MERQQILADNMRDYLRISAEKLSQLSALADKIDGGKATDADRAQAAEVSAFLLTGDKLGGCADLAAMIHGAIDPLTVEKITSNPNYSEPFRSEVHKAPQLAPGAIPFRRW